MASLQQHTSSLSGDSRHQQGQPKEILNAIKEAKTRGLPDGWTCVIDVSHSFVIYPYLLSRMLTLVVGSVCTVLEKLQLSVILL
jgi:hypothetical protein